MAAHVQPSAEEIFASNEKLQEALNEYFDTHRIPSWRRQLVAFGLSLAAGWTIGFVGNTLGTILMASALVFTGSALIAWAMYILTLALTFFASFKAGVAISSYITSRQVDEHIAAVTTRTRAIGHKVSDTVRGWFTPRMEVTQ